MYRTVWLLVPCLLGLCSSLDAGMITVDPGEIVQFTFSTDAETFGCPPSFTASDCDTLLLVAPFVSPLPDTVTAQLFDGSALLGTSSGMCCVVAFTTASSLYGSGDVVDFTSIQDGSIDGIIDLSSTQPFVLDTDIGATLDLGHATGVGATSSRSASATLTGVSIVPEPSQDAGITTLVFLALLGLQRLH